MKIETIKKISAYVDNVLAELENSDQQLTAADRIDFAAYADQIAKKLSDHASAVKKALDFGGRKEIEGQFARARISVSEQYDISPAVLLKELSPDDFLASVKALIGPARKLIPETRFKAVAKRLPDRVSISFQLKD
jgi:hypothetical protein